jgi:hypothetical protein
MITFKNHQDIRGKVLFFYPPLGVFMTRFPSPPTGSLRSPFLRLRTAAIAARPASPRQERAVFVDVEIALRVVRQ